MPYFNGAPLAEDDSATRDLSLHAANATAPVTSAGPKGGLSKVRLAASGNAVRRNPGAMYGLIFAVLGVIAALAGYGMVGIAAAVLSLAAALANGRTALSCIPSAAVLVMTCVVVVVQLAAIEDWPDFGAPTVARIAVAALCAASGFLTWHLRGALTNWKAAELAEAVAMLPAIFLAGLGVWMATMPVTRATNWFFTGADNVSHSLMVGQLSAIGHLDYSAWTYPAGWLSFVSLAVVSGGDASGAQSGLLALVSTNAAMLWSLYVLVSAATSLLAMALVRQYGGHRWAASMAGLTAGAVMCWPQFFLFTMGSGFQTTIVEAFVLAVAASEVLSGRAVQLRRVVICSAALVLTANNYPLLLPPAGILWLASVDQFRRSRVGGIDRRDLAAIAVSVCSALAIGPALQMLLSVYGVQTAQIPGFVRRLPVEWVATSLCAGVLSLTSWRRSRPAWWVGLAVVVAFVEPLAAWLFLGVSLDDYYPTKIFWHVAALGAPLTAAWCAVGCLSLSRWSERAFAAFLLSRVPHVVVTITVLIGVVGVLPAALGLWSNDGGRILQAATGSEAPQAQVVWHAGKDDTEDWKIQHLVAVYHAGGRFLMRGVPLGTSEQCETLRSVRSPAVLTRASQAEVTAHFKCASGTVSIPVSGFKGLG